MIQSMTKATEQSTIYNAKADKQSISLPKKHAHIMLTRLNIKDGLKAYGNKGDEAILK